VFSRAIEVERAGLSVRFRRKSTSYQITTLEITGKVSLEADIHTLKISLIVWKNGTRGSVSAEAETLFSQDDKSAL